MVSRLANLAMLLFFSFSIASLLLLPATRALEILAKSRMERCVRDSDNPSDNLKCENKIVLNIAVPSGSSGRESSIVAQLVEVERVENQTMETIRTPPVISIFKSAAYALYDLTYIRDVAYKPVEFYVETRKCEPDAGSDVVQQCERLRDENGHIIEHTQPVCCPCGPDRRVPTSCGNVFDKMIKGKHNTAHCVRFPGDWFHVFGIGKRTLGFNMRIELKKGSSTTVVVIGPENRTVMSGDNFLRVNLVGDFAGYTSIPSFEDFYLVTPRSNGGGQTQDLGTDFSRWMLLERVRFTLDGLECNKIGVGYEAFGTQPYFCGSPLWSCLHNQLSDFWEDDRSRLSRNQPPQYVVAGRFERINQHPNAGTHSFSVGITEVLNTNLVIELSADDIEFVYQRSPGKIISINIPTFEALTQFGNATVTVKNTGKLEASYSLTFDCTSGVSYMEEQFFIMKPEEVVTRPFYLYPTSDQAAKYECSAILKASDFAEVDRAECQFTTTATVLDNGTQVVVSVEDKNGVKGFFQAIKHIWNAMWSGLIDFFTGKACRRKCSSFFNFSCHMQYLCISWIVLFGLFIAILPTVIVLLWLLHQKGLFDPIYDWWDDRFGSGDQNYRYHSKHKKDARSPPRYHDKQHKHHHHHHHHQHHKSMMRNSSHAHKRKRNDHLDHHLLHKHAEFEINADRHRSRHEDSLRVHKEGPKHKQRPYRVSPLVDQRVYRERRHEPLLRDTRRARAVDSNDRLHRDHAHF
ncbi:Protein HAPLESS 2 [Rhynchospora pubera]|uniref:Protein HAPLESS 2 n=1 Tax=Rhynchospora pubera TaxID=906938 RepID=A0AAV8GLC8_9POAL|nr:Protein HAPLESS 2 [Rhynchospora pubera]KAJ4803828.1 Protein HAPLESS 2 [Rhynchospora pubera]